MNVAGEGFAARAWLAEHQHGRLVRRDLLHFLAQVAHQATATDWRDERWHQRARGPLPALALFQRALDGAQQLGQ